MCVLRDCSCLVGMEGKEEQLLEELGRNHGISSQNIAALKQTNKKKIIKAFRMGHEAEAEA